MFLIFNYFRSLFVFSQYAKKSNHNIIDCLKCNHATFSLLYNGCHFPVKGENNQWNKRTIVHNFHSHNERLLKRLFHCIISIIITI